uniref:Uncharacterized protein n=1 Tax=Amblyomma aureolatum TaxID=187763 RepID=A0A1E1X1J7_9ACAR
MTVLINFYIFKSVLVLSIFSPSVCVCLAVVHIGTVLKWPLLSVLPLHATLACPVMSHWTLSIWPICLFAVLAVSIRMHFPAYRVACVTIWMKGISIQKPKGYF